MISEQTVLMQLNWLSRDSVGKTVFYFFFQWQLENRIITIAPVVSFIWSLKTVIYSSLWLGDRNFVLTQKLLASPKKLLSMTPVTCSLQPFSSIYICCLRYHMFHVCAACHMVDVLWSHYMFHTLQLYSCEFLISCSLSSSCFRQCHISHLNTLESCALSFSDTII